METRLTGPSGGRAGVHATRLLLPLVGFGLLVALWWFAATFLTTLMPGPLAALRANLDDLAHPFYVRGPGDIGVGHVSMQRVLIGVGLGSAVAIPLGFLIGLSPVARRMFDPLVVFKLASPVAWLPVFVVFLTSFWPTAINTAVDVALVPQEQTLELYDTRRQTIVLVTHDVDEALLMADRIVVLRAEGVASAGEVIGVPFGRPRDRKALREDRRFLDLRNATLDPLERYFGTMQAAA